MSGTPSIHGLFTHGRWLMLPGERAALEGVLELVRPALSIEIGTNVGGSLARIAAHSAAVHAFDLRRAPELTDARFPNVTFHIGDSHELLPPLLEELAEAGKNVDFALVDGDHTAVGAQRDVEHLLESPSVTKTIILLHDTLNGNVRAGFEQVDFGAFDKVRFVDLDFVPGRVQSEGPGKDSYWTGFGIVVVGWELESGATWPATYSVRDVYHAFGSSLDKGAERSLGHRELGKLEREVALERELRLLMERSLSWRLTAPLRSGRRFVRNVVRR